MSRNGKTLGETWFTGVTLLRKLSKAWRCRLDTHICETLVQLLLGSIAWSFSPVCSFHYPSPKFPGRSFRKSFLVVRTSLSLAITLRKEGRVGLLGETPNGLSASKTLNESHLLVYTTLVCQASSYTPASLGCTILSMKLTANANRQSHFDECHQLFIPTHNATLAIATMRVGNPDCLPVGIDSRDTAPTGSAKPVCDNFPAFHEFDGSSRCS